MIKKSIVLLLSLLLISCAGVGYRKGALSINPAIQRAYIASVSITTEESKTYGSGTIIRNRAGEQLIVVTVAHVIRSMQKRKQKVHVLTTYSKIPKKMMVWKISDDRDLALLISYSKEVSDGPYVELAGSAPSIGDQVWAIGGPLGKRLTVTKGIVSNFEKGKKKQLYRFTAEIFFGNSGGGLFNERNELVGVVHGMQYIIIGFNTIFVPGAGFAVSLKDIKSFL